MTEDLMELTSIAEALIDTEYADRQLVCEALIDDVRAVLKGGEVKKLAELEEFYR
jgi:hypothetical protein